MLLVLHITGAVVVFGAGAYSLIIRSRFFRKIMRAGVAFECTTGALLATTEGSSIGSFCVKIGLYFSFWLMIEGAFIINERRRAHNLGI